MKLDELTQPYKEVCDNCLSILTVYKDKEGVSKFRCPVCGTKVTIHRVSRYHIVKDLRYPKQ